MTCDDAACPHCGLQGRRKAQRIARQRGWRALVESGPARRHVSSLLEQGIKVDVIARAAGVSARSVQRMLSDETTMVFRCTEVRLLALQARFLRRDDRPLSAEVYVEDYDFLRESGLSDAEAVARLQVTPRYMHTLLTRREQGLAPFGRLSQSQVKSG